MPATSEKQRRFFGAVMAAKKGKGGVGGEARRAAGQMSKQQIKDFLKKKGETVNEQAFIQGFLTKCAEANVDPEILVKQSFTLAELGVAGGLTGLLGAGLGAAAPGREQPSTAGKIMAAVRGGKPEGKQRSRPRQAGKGAVIGAAVPPAMLGGAIGVSKLKELIKALALR